VFQSVYGKRGCRRNLAAAGCLLFSGCSGAGRVGAQSAVAQPRSPESIVAGRPAPRLNAADPLLYVNGYRNSVVEVYDLAEPGDPLVDSITNGVDGPGGMAIDDRGTLYVANNNNGTVTEYPFGSTAPSLTLSQDLSFPTDVAVAENGDVYVANRGSQSGIAKYKAGQTTVSEYITSPLIQKPEQIFFGPERTLYISDDNTGVSVRKDGIVKSLGLQGLGSITSGLALDRRNGNLFVGDNSSAEIHVFLRGSKTSTYALSVNGPDFLVIGKVGRRQTLFAPDSGSSTVYFFRPDGRSPFGHLLTGADLANGVAFKPAGIP
jgi:hypothetical protein